MFLQSLPVWMIPVNASAIGCIGWPHVRKAQSCLFTSGHSLSNQLRWLTQDWRLLAVCAGFTLLLHLDVTSSVLLESAKKSQKLGASSAVNAWLNQEETWEEEPSH